MSERHPHTNPWAERLQQVTLPDSAAAWRSMEAVLDREMPVRENSHRRRWLLLILLLLLVIGICNCPGRGRRFGSSSMTTGGATTPSGVPKPVAGAIPATGVIPAAGATSANDPTRANTPTITNAPTTRNTPTTTNTPTTSNIPPPSAASKLTTPATPAKDRSSRTNPTPHKTSPASNNPGASRNTRTRSNPPHANAQVHPNSPTRNYVKENPDSSSQTDTTVQTNPQSRTRKPAVTNPDTLRKNPQPVSVKDSAHKKPPTPPKKQDQKEKENGIVVAIGLNQFFPVGGQQVSDYNSGGISGTLGDYIPIPMLRYYFSKKLYLQLEAQFNAPQYTNKNLVISSSPPDSLSPGRVSTSSVSIQKLFYFNLPLSVHYSPIEGLSLGAGLQFSRLRNAIGSFDTTITNTISTPVDSLVGKHLTSLRGDSVYQRISTNEFRFLVDVNYTYKQFILGLRYNQALSKFINVQLGPGSLTQARNNSLQIYFRYILWDARKRKLTISITAK